MTAEIAILNKGAVALAADSAVTIQTPTGPKIYESVNKLFALIKNRPIGIMIFDSAELIGVPWETIIKVYRMERHDFHAETLKAYAEDFMSFLSSSPVLLGDDLQRQFLDESIRSRLITIRRGIDNEVNQILTGRTRAGGLGKQRLVAVIENILSQTEAHVANLPVPSWAEDFDSDALADKYEEMVKAAISDVFQALPLGVRRERRLFNVVCEWLTRDNNELQSGVIIAGYGDREYFPRMLQFGIAGLFDNRLRLVPRDEVTIGPSEPAIIAPFAQRDVVDAFMAGLSTRLEGALMNFVETALTQGFPQLAERVVQGLAPGVLVPGGPLTSNLNDVGTQLWRELEATIRQLMHQEALPIVHSVAFLPKDELALMAESLVNLTSLRRRVSITEAQTVGGPVDVAVISRGDGFVWIKRKHYFDEKLNPSWAMTHAGAR